MIKNCPLCGSTHTHKIDNINKDRLRAVYLKDYATDIGHLVTEDLSLYHCDDCDLKYFDPMITGDQNFYADLQKFDWYYKDDKLEYDYVAKYIKARDSVLEIGCGKGAFSKKIKTKKYVGLEFSETAKDLAVSQGIDVRNQSIEEHANENKEQYDVVCSFQVIEHVTRPNSFFEAKVACLKPKGTLIMAVPSEDSFLEHIQDFSLNMPPHHVSKWTDKCLTGLGERHGLELVEMYHEPLNSFHIPWYFTSMMVYQVNRLLGIKHSLIKSPKHWASHRLATLLHSALGNDYPNAYKGHGHTVIAVYKKSANGTPPKNEQGIVA